MPHHKSLTRSRTSVHNSKKLTEHGVIIYPPSIEFSNIKQNQCQLSNISIQNISYHLKHIKVVSTAHPNLFSIVSKSQKDYQSLSAGCSIDIPIQFHSKKPIVSFAFVVIVVIVIVIVLCCVIISLL